MILPRHDCVFLWGLAERTGDSFQHIWRHYHHALDRLGKPAVWLPDEEASRDLLRPGRIVFAVDVAAKHLGPPVDGVHYLLHNISDDHPVRDGLDPARCVYLQVWTNDCADRGESWGPVRRWDPHSRVLYQPWGTNLLPDEFMEPVYSAHSNTVCFVGSVWDGNGQGNRAEIAELQRAVEARGLTFDHRAGVDDDTNARLVREARVAPAIAGQWQVEHDYLPCRVFKNVSYGQLAVTNVAVFEDLLGEYAGTGDRPIEDLLDEALKLREQTYKHIVREQQQAVRNYTYRTSLEMIGRAFDS